MEIDSTQVNRNSETEFIDKFSMYVDSGAGIVHVRTNEMLRACLSIRRHAVHDNAMVKEWDIVNGFRTIDSKKLDDMLSEGDNNIDIASAFGAPLNLIREEERGSNREGMYYFVYIAPHIFMENNPYLAQMLTFYSHVLPSRNVVVVLVTPDVPLPIENNQVLSLHFNPPGIGELKEYLTGLVKDTEPNFSDGVDMSGEEYDKVCYVGSGMTKNHFEMYASLSIVEAGRDGKTSLGIEELTEGISIGKTDVVNSSDILELYPSTEMSNVGGLENLKGWVSRRKACYSDDAREFGVEAPKGIVLVGPPGTGKSLVAKAVSAELGIPLVRLDFGRVFNSLVGASEGRMRQALRMVESMAPVVLFCVAGHTEIALADGTQRKIEDVFNEMQETGNTPTLRGVDPNTGALIDLPLRTIIRTQGKPMVRITSESGREIEVTTDHRLLINRSGERVWVAAAELQEGDDLVEV